MTLCVFHHSDITHVRDYSPPQLLHLGRYTHRIDISNNRIISMDKDTVTITVKDYKNKNKAKTITLGGVEFIRRFLMHILPKAL
nr:transposase [Geosporobacter ferrireducens]